MPVSPAFRPSLAHASLGGEFYDAVAPADSRNKSCASATSAGPSGSGWTTLTDAEWIAHFGRFEPLPGSFAEPLALRYHGHQFRTYNPDLGDGRGFLFAQLRDLEDGRLLDLGTKGSGRTPWSRTGDGRLTLKGGVREVLATEMLEALGVDTSKILQPDRDRRGADARRRAVADALRRCWCGSATRISASAASSACLPRRARAASQSCSTTRSRTYMPELWRDDAADARRRLPRGGLPPRRAAPARNGWSPASSTACSTPTTSTSPARASTTARGASCRCYDPAFTAAYFDETGLYAFGRQPDTLLWNLTRLAECLLPLARQAELEAVLRGFEPALPARTSTPRCCAGSASRPPARTPTTALVARASGRS